MADRPQLGLPASWGIIRKWLRDCKPAQRAKPAAAKAFKKKCPEIKKRASYSAAPNAAFWENFPAFYPVPKAQNRINLELLEEMVSNCWDRWGSQQRRIAKKTLNTLREGASTVLSHSLPGMNYPNAKSAMEHGEMLTDTIAHWVKTGMVAGPFEAPPLSGFRCNPLMAVAQKTKVRPVLNLSAPLGGVF